MKNVLVLTAFIVLLMACSKGGPSLSEVPPPPEPALRDTLIKSIKEE